MCTSINLENVKCLLRTPVTNWAKICKQSIVVVLMLSVLQGKAALSCQASCIVLLLSELRLINQPMG